MESPTSGARPGPPSPAELRDILAASLRDIAGLPDWDSARACVILSGGLDSSIVASLGRDTLGLSAAFTVLCSPAATDRPFAALVAAAVGLEHHVLEPSLAELLREELPACVRVLQSFDPMSLRNDMAVCHALRAAAALGFTCAVTGDGADELLGGYNFTHWLDEAAWEHNRRRMAELMQFGSVPLGRHFGILVASPFTQPAVVAAALRCSKADCVQPRPADADADAGSGAGSSSGGAGTAAAAAGEGQPAQQQAPLQLLGKMPLRRAVPDVPHVRWRGKDPIEVGCGTTELGDRAWLPGAPAGYFSSRISDAEYEAGRAAAAAQGVTIRDKEHLAYYEEFRRQFLDGQTPGKPRYGSDPCPACGWQLSHPTQTFCCTCGHYDANMRGGKAPPTGAG